jgi:hypothetical protein
VLGLGRALAALPPTGPKLASTFAGESAQRATVSPLGVSAADSTQAESTNPSARGLPNPGGGATHAWFERRECGHRLRRSDLVQPVVVEGDLLDQDVEVIVNAWNRNLFPWWLLLPQGVSGTIKRRAGLAPFRELRRFGLLPLGGAVLTSAAKSVNADETPGVMNLVSVRA